MLFDETLIELSDTEYRFSTFAAKLDCIFNRYKGRNFYLYFKMYIIYASLFTRIDLTKIFVMPLDFADVKNNENMSKGMTYRTH